MTGGNRLPLGKFLDDLPKTLYVVAHIVFLAIGVWLWPRARGDALPYSEALLLYTLSQIVFFGYFANWITLKMAVLAEQTLMVAMVLVIVLRAT
ncbi:MAG: hypothetical protein EXR60_02930 [Dehalococcoidia bacterium]|nr:hypothetical protein [Dehalococcoidia bacterium]